MPPKATASPGWPVGSADFIPARPAGQGAVLRGAAIIEADYTGDGAPEFVYDPQVLAALKGAAGSFARVSGSWRDF